VGAPGAYTFVIADLAGYTALTEAHGGAEAAKTIARYTELASSALTPGVRVAEGVGDQLLLVSNDPCSAVTTAVRLRHAIGREPLFLGVRIGIDAGEALEENGRYFGSALNIAARVAAHAHGGQILCTAHVVSALRGLAGVRCASLGPAKFKNVSEPIDLFEVISEDDTGAVVDPVCHMHVEAATAPARLPFDDTTYFFCSFQCAEAFARHPRAYV
jgi:class 3 adenylate cyclase/YHS domain-containing protein